MADDDEPIMETCFLCTRPFHFGNHRWEGRHIPQWGVNLCDGCIKRNSNGVMPEARPHLIPYLESKGIEVRYNAKGWIDIPLP